MAPTTVWAKDLILQDYVFDLGSGSTTSELPTYGGNELPSAGERVVLDLDSAIFNNTTNNIFAQDETGRGLPLFGIEGSWGAEGVDLVFRQDGQDLVGNQVTIGVADQAKFTYSMNAGFSFGKYAIEYQLQKINLLSTVGYGLNVSASESRTDDLKATLLGGGNITFGYSAENSDEGFLTLAGSEKNTYTGWTYVGYSTDGAPSAGKTTIYFGKDAAFGDTANLDVEGSSNVYIGGVNRNQDYSQTGALSYMFAIPRHEREGSSVLIIALSFLGRPSIVAVRIRNSVVSIQIARRTITIIGIAAKTRSWLPVRSFNLSFPFQRPKSPCLAYRETAGFGGACSPLFRLRRGCTLNPSSGAARIRNSVVSHQIARRTSTIKGNAAKTRSDSATGV